MVTENGQATFTLPQVSYRLRAIATMALERPKRGSILSNSLFQPNG
jgi:hypothetical protein